MKTDTKPLDKNAIARCFYYNKPAEYIDRFASTIENHMAHNHHEFKALTKVCIALRNELNWRILDAVGFNSVGHLGSYLPKYTMVDQYGFYVGTLELAWKKDKVECFRFLNNYIHKNDKNKFIEFKLVNPLIDKIKNEAAFSSPRNSIHRAYRFIDETTRYIRTWANDKAVISMEKFSQMEVLDIITNISNRENRFSDSTIQAANAVLKKYMEQNKVPTADVLRQLLSDNPFTFISIDGNGGYTASKLQFNFTSQDHTNTSYLHRFGPSHVSAHMGEVFDYKGVMAEKFNIDDLITVLKDFKRYETRDDLFEAYPEVITYIMAMEAKSESVTSHKINNLPVQDTFYPDLQVATYYTGYISQNNYASMFMFIPC